MATEAKELLAKVHKEGDISTWSETRGLFKANRIIHAKGGGFGEQVYDLSGCVFYRCL